MRSNEYGRVTLTAALRDGEPCRHPGCLSHVTHPCEGCGRIAGRTAMNEPKVQPFNSATETSTQTEESHPEKFAMKASDIATSNSATQTSVQITSEPSPPSDKPSYSTVFLGELAETTNVRLTFKDGAWTVASEPDTQTTV